VETFTKSGYIFPRYARGAGWTNQVTCAKPCKKPNKIEVSAAGD
jgi:hypothetical protein